MDRPRFTRSFTQQPPVPEDGIEAATEVMRSGRIHRYNVASSEGSEAAALEREFAAWQGSRYCLAVVSGRQAMQIALRAAGMRPGDYVLTNAFTLVPRAIAGVRAEPVLVEITEDLVIDLDDLVTKARASSSRVLLLSLMRGHLPDMDPLMQVALAEGLTVIRGCAHTMGATGAGRRSGSFGLAGCFSTQAYKHMNSGEGGLLVSDGAEFNARATMLSCSYMLYGGPGAGPDDDAFRDARLDTPNMSGRMDNLCAALLRPQLCATEDAIAAWNQRHDRVATHLSSHNAIRLPRRSADEAYVGSSIQFLIPDLPEAEVRAFLADTAARGVEFKWFGAHEPVGFTSAHKSWRYITSESLPLTDQILAGVFDIRLPLTFMLEDCDLIAGHILDAESTIDLGAAA